MAEDVIRSLESVIAMARAGVARMPPGQMRAQNPDLFEVSAGLVVAVRLAEHSKAVLLKSLKLPAETNLSGAAYALRNL